jgi:hypothetical protein
LYPEKRSVSITHRVCGTIKKAKKIRKLEKENWKKKKQEGRLEKRKKEKGY